MADSFEDRTWSVDVYRVSDRTRQQRILRSFFAAPRADVTALGTQTASEWFVVTETSSSDDRSWSRRTIIALDADAFRAYSFRKPPMLHRRARSS